MAVKAVEVPAQIVTSGPALTVGSGLTVTVTVVVPVQPCHVDTGR